MRFMYSLEQHLIIKSPTTAFERISKDPKKFNFPIKVYRHERCDINKEDKRFVRHQATTGAHIATIVFKDNRVKIKFEPGY